MLSSVSFDILILQNSISTFVWLSISVFVIFLVPKFELKMYKIENASDILLASTIFTDLILVSIKKKKKKKRRMKGLLCLIISWRLWFSQELTSSQQFHYNRVIVVGGAIAQYPPWIGFVAWHSRTHRVPNFKSTFFFSLDNNYYTFFILHSPYTLSRGLKTQYLLFQNFVKKNCVRNVQQ